MRKRLKFLVLTQLLFALYPLKALPQPAHFQETERSKPPIDVNKPGGPPSAAAAKSIDPSRAGGPPAASSGADESVSYSSADTTGVAVADALPDTGSQLPVVGLTGLTALLLALVVRGLRRRTDTE